MIWKAWERQQRCGGGGNEGRQLNEFKATNEDKVKELLACLTAGGRSFNWKLRRVL